MSVRYPRTSILVKFEGRTIGVADVTLVSGMSATAEIEIASLDLPHDVAALFFHQVKGSTARLVIVDEPDPLHIEDTFNGDELADLSGEGRNARQHQI